MTQSIYQHFKKEEQPFINAVMDWVSQVDHTYAAYATAFLNPREQEIVTSLVQRTADLKVYFFGGTPQAERQCAMITPEYFVPAPEDYQIRVCNIEYPTKFSQLTHGQILGTLLGSGVNRTMIGDIVTKDQRWQVWVNANIADFLALQVTRIGATSVQLVPVSLEEAFVGSVECNREEYIVSSLRLDTIIASVLALSRQKVRTLIEAGKVQLNWVRITDVGQGIQCGDYVSIRGFGRFQFIQSKGTTKKGKQIVVIESTKQQKTS